MLNYESVEKSALVVTATLTISSLKFSSEPTADTLYCDSRDEAWWFDLPTIEYEEEAQATVRFDPAHLQNNLFELTGKRVALASSV